MPTDSTLRSTSLRRRTLLFGSVLLCLPLASPALAASPDSCAGKQARGRWQPMASFPQSARVKGPQRQPYQAHWDKDRLVVTDPQRKQSVAWDACTNRWLPPQPPAQHKSNATPGRLDTSRGQTVLRPSAQIGVLRRPPHHLQEFAGATLHHGSRRAKLPANNAPAPRLEHLVVSDDTRIAVLGGRINRGAAAPDAAVLDLATLRWSKLPTEGMPRISRPFTIAHLSKDRLVVQGRRTGSGTSRGGPARVDGAIFTFATGRWTPLAKPPYGLRGERVNSYGVSRAAAVISQGHFIGVVRTMDESGVYGAVLDAARNSWRVLPSKKVRGPYGRPSLSAYATPSGRILLVTHGGKPVVVSTLDLARATSQPISTRQLRLAPNMKSLWTGERLILWGGHTVTQSAGDSCRNPPPGVGCDPVIDPSLTRFTPSYDGYWIRP